MSITSCNHLSTESNGQCNSRAHAPARSTQYALYSDYSLIRSDFVILAQSKQHPELQWHRSGRGALGRPHIHMAAPAVCAMPEQQPIMLLVPSDFLLHDFSLDFVGTRDGVYRVNLSTKITKQECCPNLGCVAHVPPQKKSPLTSPI